MNYMNNYNTPCAPSPAFYKASAEPWEKYLNNQNMPSAPSFQIPAPEFTEMEFEKKQDDMFGFIEEDAIPYSDENSHRDYVSNFDPSDADFFFTDADAENVFDGERSQCLKEEEEFNYSTLSTEQGFSVEGNNSQGSFIEDYSLLDGSFCLENELTNRCRNILQNRTEDEKQYIDKVWPFLLSSLKDAYSNYNLPLTNEIVQSLLEQLLHGKQVMIGAERVVLENIVNNELDEVREWRPEEKVTVDELNMNTRKEKKAPKGNRNTSNLNHLNENYVSNIFQFAKRNFPEDKDVQKIGNERNISASNFKKMVQPKLTDDIMMRKARARINGSGKELVGNIEYWMKDGYFDQCADRQKYLVNKEKALRDLALSGTKF